MPFPPSPFTPTPGPSRSQTPVQRGPGPSSLRRLVTSRSDVFLAAPPVGRSDNLRSDQKLSRRLSATNSSSAARTSGSTRTSWDTDKPPTRSSTLSSFPQTTNPSSSSSSRAVPPTPPRQVPGRPRAPSSNMGLSPSKSSYPPRHLGPGGITLPLNNSVSQLATLSHSAHTLSPYARGHEHIAVRSFPHLGGKGAFAGLGGMSNGMNGNGGGSNASTTSLSAIAEVQPVKARRKRIFRMSTNANKDVKAEEDSEEPPLSPDLDIESPRNRPVSLHDSSPSPPPLSSTGVGARSTGTGTGRGARSNQLFPQMQMGTSRQSRRPVSLTAAASQVMSMGEGSGPGSGRMDRPSYGRSPDSRTSYGFPPRYGHDR